MKLIQNSGTDRVIDELRRTLIDRTEMNIVSPAFSLFAFSELQELLGKLETCRLVLQATERTYMSFLGSESDRPYRNRLQTRWIGLGCSDWIRNKTQLRVTQAGLPQSCLLIKNTDSSHLHAITGACPLTTDGLGLTPGNQFGLIQCSENPEEGAALASWFDSQWKLLPASSGEPNSLLAFLDDLVAHKAPSLIYYQILYHLFKDVGDDLDEERIVNSATGIRQTVVWKKLYKFQRDGVVGAIDKLERFGGCIIADSVGLGKTFEALAIVKYYELRNDRVLVLCPKRLRDNWTVYTTNDHRNILNEDRFNYDVLNHTDLSRDVGMTGDIDLSFINWGNYDLVVIDESHNFRNKFPHKGHETRYDRLMNSIIKSGVKTKVLMLSATPVNNRLTDLRNQIAFATEADDLALAPQGIASIDATVRRAQKQFNTWMTLTDDLRTPTKLLDMLGFEYFKLLDLCTIARSRKHIEKYYGLSETGKFPERLKPINIKSDVDSIAEFPPIRKINDEIRRLNLSSYAPLRYILPAKKVEYENTYSTQLRDGKSIFLQADREESLVHLMRVNLLKRMESSVTSFALTLERQLEDVETLLERIENHDESVEGLSIEDIDIDDPTFETLLVGRKVKVLLQDVDRIRWEQDLVEDRNRLKTLLAAARQINPDRDAKLIALKNEIRKKCTNPINPGNRKAIVFTAFADTAEYLYRELAQWAQDELGLHSALVTGKGRNKTSLPGLRLDLSHILTAFSPISKERKEEFAPEGDIDLLIATDCISEGQNLQDCDYLVNYDIHWNPVRIIQRFGRIDRLGSVNDRIQLVNFWPNLELEEYINLEQRVSGRMVLSDISATGEENLIEKQSGDQMNDLEYRRKQLEKLRETVIDLEDLSSGISITDLTLTDFRIELAEFHRQHPGRLEELPQGVFAVTVSGDETESDLPPGVLFFLRAASEQARRAVDPSYPLAPHYVVHVGEDGTVLLPFTQAKQVLDRLKKTATGRDLPDVGACKRFDKATRKGADMTSVQRLLASAVTSIAGKSEEHAVASLFAPGGTHAFKGEFQGINDFEVINFMVVLPESPRGEPA